MTRFQFKYDGWDVFLFTQNLGGIVVYFAAMNELHFVCSSIESYWDAFIHLRDELDEINRLQDECAAIDDELPF